MTRPVIVAALAAGGMSRAHADATADAYAAQILRGAAAQQRTAAHPRCDCCLDAAARLDEQAVEATPKEPNR
ncbi:hypothetical protein ACODT4_20665 [Streptomyces sp. 2.9]|uniref:hypothetical protein n=1 Tax=Streptomyces tritrimontium TaxID=3406573 RepID=UPI003BB7FB2D